MSGKGRASRRAELTSKHSTWSLDERLNTLLWRLALHPSVGKEMLKFSLLHSIFDRMLIVDGVPIINPEMEVQSASDIPYLETSSSEFSAT